MNPRVLWAVLLGGCTALGACSSDPSSGYALGERPFSKDIKSIAVPVFQNVTFSRGIETRLTEAIIKELRKTTPWSVTSTSSAQTVLSGTIVRSELGNNSYGRDSGLAEDQAVILTVEFEWKDARSGKVLVARREFRAAENFVPARGVGERIELAQNATIQTLARDIVGELRTNW